MVDVQKIEDYVVVVLALATVVCLVLGYVMFAVGSAFGSECIMYYTFGIRLIFTSFVLFVLCLLVMYLFSR